jgi:DTW domain-containing protein YfiP
VRSKGHELDTNPHFLDALAATDTVPLLLFPGASAVNMNQTFKEEWQAIVPPAKKPLFIVIDGTWTQAHAILRRSHLLKMLPRVSFETLKLSEYQFKNQPHPACLSSVEGVHRVMEVLAERGWHSLPEKREHDQMIEIFRGMVRFQMRQERHPRFENKMLRRGRGFKAETPSTSAEQNL